MQGGLPGIKDEAFSPQPQRKPRESYSKSGRKSGKFKENVFPVVICESEDQGTDMGNLAKNFCSWDVEPDSKYQ